MTRDLLLQFFHSEALPGLPPKIDTFKARREIVHQGETPPRVSLLLEGWAARSKQLIDGRRQHLSIVLPGEFYHTYVSHRGELDYFISAISDVRVAHIDRAEFDVVLASYPAVARAVLRGDLIREAIHRELILSLGVKSARERIAHFLAETFIRLRSAGLVDENTCQFPLTQADLAEVTGLTAVHVNRTLQELRGEGLIQLDARQLTVPCLESLMSIGQLEPNYLQLALVEAEDEPSEAGVSCYPDARLTLSTTTASAKYKV